jgi:glycosyltransferase involved in cell wall biosynthesis
MAWYPLGVPGDGEMMTESKKIKVCLIAPKTYPLFNPEAKNVKNPFGGSEVDLYLLALELAKDNDFEVSFIVADYGQSPVETWYNVKVIKSINFDKNAAAGVMALWRAMRQADADVYFHEAASAGTFLISLFCRVHNKPFVYRTAHQDECDGTYLKQHYLAGKLFKTGLRWAKLLMTQNDTDRNNLLKTMNLDSVVVRGGHHIPEQSTSEREFILWMARSADFKRPKLFLDLAEKFPNEKFVMVCSKALDDQNYDQLVARAKTIKNLEFLPQVSFEKIGDYFGRAKVFVCTSYSEGFPNTYLNAWINATPILALEVNPDGVFDKSACGICCKGDFGRLVESLRSMLMENKYLELGRNARKYVEEHHDIKKKAEEYKKLFSNVVCIDAG